MPTWTGQSGEVARPKKPRFGRKGSGGDAAAAKLFSGKGKSGDEKLLSSSDLLAKMRERNRFLGGGGGRETGGGGGEEADLFRPDSLSSQSEEERENLELLADIRNFVAFQVGAQIVLKTPLGVPPQGGLKPLSPREGSTLSPIRSLAFIKVSVLTKSPLYWRSEWRVNFYAAMESTSQRHVPSFLWKGSIDRAYYQGV